MTLLKTLLNLSRRAEVATRPHCPGGRGARASGTRGVFGVDFECCIAANIDDTDSQTISQVCGCIEPSRKCVVASVFSKSGKHKGELVEIQKVKKRAENPQISIK